MAKKYIDADLLRKEIERQKSLFSTKKEKEGLSKTDKLSLGARIASLEETILLISSLQQEVDLERDAIQFCFDKGLNVTPYQAKTIAHHFYELGKNSK